MLVEFEMLTDLCNGKRLGRLTEEFEQPHSLAQRWGVVRVLLSCRPGDHGKTRRGISPIEQYFMSVSLPSLDCKRFPRGGGFLFRLFRF